MRDVLVSTKQFSLLATQLERREEEESLVDLYVKYVRFLSFILETADNMMKYCGWNMERPINFQPCRTSKEVTSREQGSQSCQKTRYVAAQA